jgi:Tfp pilus assembly protein PilF
MKQGSDEQLGLMDELGKKAEALAGQYPDQPKALIWDGIILSERASMANERNSLTGGFTALRLAKQAKAVLEKSYAIDPAALDAGAATSLGVLYYRVPGFPIGFGDTDKARALLEEAVRTAPDSLDAEYFYGDFLYTSKQVPQAVAVFQKALAIPQNADRPIWDHNRRLVIEHVLKEIQTKG